VNPIKTWKEDIIVSHVQPQLPLEQPLVVVLQIHLISVRILIPSVPINFHVPQSLVMESVELLPICKIINVPLTQ
jgi:hypothetical protein